VIIKERIFVMVTDPLDVKDTAAVRRGRARMARGKNHEAEKSDPWWGW
jgi:hypothetical protein